MRYTVTWVPTALNKLADLYNNAPDRMAITEAANRIDQLLAVDPDQKGQAFQDNRILFQSPLAVTFAVYPDDRRVDVLEVERISQ